jgi:hypothetical protein
VGGQIGNALIISIKTIADALARGVKNSNKGDIVTLLIDKPACTNAFWFG